MNYRRASEFFKMSAILFSMYIFLQILYISTYKLKENQRQGQDHDTTAPSSLWALKIKFENNAEGESSLPLGNRNLKEQQEDHVSSGDVALKAGIQQPLQHETTSSLPISPPEEEAEINKEVERTREERTPQEVVEEDTQKDTLTFKSQSLHMDTQEVPVKEEVEIKSQLSFQQTEQRRENTNTENKQELMRERHTENVELEKPNTEQPESKLNKTSLVELARRNQADMTFSSVKESSVASGTKSSPNTSDLFSLMCPRYSSKVSLVISFYQKQLPLLKMNLLTWAKESFFPCTKLLASKSRDYSGFFNEALGSSINIYLYPDGPRNQSLVDELTSIWSNISSSRRVDGSGQSYRLGQCFGKLQFLWTELPAAISGQDETRNSALRFLHLFDLLHLERVEYFFWMEPDTWPIRTGWLDKIYTESICGNDFWMKGSSFKGGEEWFLKDKELGEHINGNALYNRGSKDFREQIWDQIILSKASSSFDISISHVFKDVMYQRDQGHNYLYVDWIYSYGRPRHLPRGKRDLQLDIEAFKKTYPNCFLVHGIRGHLPQSDEEEMDRELNQDMSQAIEREQVEKEKLRQLEELKKSKREEFERRNAELREAKRMARATQEQLAVQEDTQRVNNKDNEGTIVRMEEEVPDHREIEMQAGQDTAQQSGDGDFEIEMIVEKKNVIERITNNDKDEEEVEEEEEENGKENVEDESENEKEEKEEGAGSESSVLLDKGEQE